jgi:hypothetical protein
VHDTAARLTWDEVPADGRRVFVKAVSADQNPESPEMLRREAAVAAVLPDGVPAPGLLGFLDDGHWVAGVYEHVGGRLPRLPCSGLTAVTASIPMP